MRQLAGVMGEIARDQGFFSLRSDTHRDMSGRMPQRGLEGHFWADDMIKRDEVDEAGLEDGPHAVVKRRSLRVRIAFRGLPVLKLAPCDQVAGVGKGGDPAAVDLHRVPPHMIDMQMGAEHRVDSLPRSAGASEILEETRLEAAPRRYVAYLVVADTGIHDDPSSWRLDQEGVDAHFELPRLIGELRRQPSDGAHGLRRRLGEDEAAAAERFDLDDTFDRDVPDDPAQHGVAPPHPR